MRNPFKTVWEMIVPSFGVLRSYVKGWQGFWGNRPLFDQTSINYDNARQLYRNDAEDTQLGAGFVRPVIDLSVEFMDLPTATSDDEQRDNFLNECIHDYWAPEIQEMIRNACRDSKTIVRIVQPMLTNPLVTASEREHCSLVIYPPEQVEIVRDPADNDVIERALVTHYVNFDESVSTDEPQGSAKPRTKEHTIIEELKPTSIRYFDKTDNQWLDDWGMKNTWGFVPLLEVWNEYDSTLSGGQSDIESIMPFLKAFHEVLLQSLKAHKYHATPKLRMNLKDVGAFVKNNWPTLLDANGNPVAGAKIPWEGSEVLFLSVDEKAEFLEARSVLGDSKVLLEFLIDCISIASETPEWAFMRVESGTSQGSMNAQVIPFERKIRRKRRSYQGYIQMLLKMVLVINGQQPERVKISWPQVRVDDFVSLGQAFQQFVMGFDVAASHEWMSDQTIQKELGKLFASMKSPELESADAKSNVVIEPPLAPASDTQGAQGSGSNGSGSKAKGKAAIATTAASRS